MNAMDRRRFLKVTAITGTSAALASCGSPENQIIRFVPEEELVPGVAVFKPSVCPLCNAGCGVTARVMDGDAEVFRKGQAGVTRMGLVKKLEGDPAHAISQGKLCVRGQAAVQVTYHPDRIVAPLRRSGDRFSGRFDEISWDEALKELVDRLDAVVASGGASGIAWLSRPRRGRRQVLVAELLRRLGAPAPIAFEAFDDGVLRRANELSFGQYRLPTFDLAHTRYLINFGADLLGTWNSPLAHGVAYGRMRQGRAGVRAKFVQVEPRVSQTGASADEWVAVRPGTEGALALGMAHVIMKAGLRSAEAAGGAGALVDGWSTGLAAFTPEAVEKATGVSAARVERMAREFASYGPAMAVIGGAALAHTNGLAQALAVNALNALVGSVGVEGGLSFMPQAAPGPAVRSLGEALAAKPPQLLLVDEANPVFGAPAAWKVADWLRQVPFIASFGSFVDDTSRHADLILPDHSFLESWVESAPESGAKEAVTTVAGPVMRPLYDTRPTPDVLLDVSRRLKRPLDPPLPWQTFEDMLQASVPAAPSAASASGAIARPTAVGWRAPEFDGDAQEYPFHFAPYASQALLDGSIAHLPWLQELPDPLTSAMWCSWVEVNAHAAARLGLADGDVVEVASRHGSVRAPVVISPGIGPDAVAMPVGQGHERFTRYASGRGANPLHVLAPVTEAATGQLAWSATRVKVTKVSDADGSLILFAGATRERPFEKMGRG